MNNPTIFKNPQELITELANNNGDPVYLGISDPIRIDQAKITGFADVTGDHQWIHVDPDKCVAENFNDGRTIAHGKLIDSIVTGVMMDIVQVEGIQNGLNYGAAETRFPGSVTVDSDIVVQGWLTGAEEKKGNVQAMMLFKVWISGEEAGPDGYGKVVEGHEHRPVCTTTPISVYVPE